MIWHILKKDWRLMWKATLAVAGLQLAFASIQLKSELGQGTPVIQQFGTVLMMLWLIASAILVVMLVHQDAIPGTKQDWLIRPIRRRDVLLAKIVFATLAVQGATIAGDIVQGLGSGFPLKQTLGAAMSRAALGFIAITLPAVALGALTQSIAQAMVMSVILIGGAFLFTVMAIAISGGTHQFDPTNMTGVEWIPNLVRYGVILAGTLIVVTWQYRTRKTFQGYIAIGVLSLAVLGSQVIPWTPVFAVEKNFASQPGSGGAIDLTWRDAALDKIANSNAPLEETLPGAHVASAEGPRLVLPLSISGLPANSVLKEDKSQIALLDSSGGLLYEGDGDDLEIRHEDGASGPGWFNQTVKIPAQLFQEHENSKVQIHATYSLTLFTLHKSYTMKALNDDQMLEGWGHCRTKVGRNYTAIEMVCLQMGKGPTCATVFLEDTRDGSRNQVNTACYPNYSPYLERPIPDATTRFRLVLPYRDPAGITKFPIDASKLAEAQIRIRVYEPIDHITRVLTSPVIPIRRVVAQ